MSVNVRFNHSSKVGSNNMFSSSTTASLRSLNEINARPKRTSYGEMSTWFFMDNMIDKQQEYDKSFMDLKEFEVDCNHHEITLPVIVNKMESNKKKSSREAPPTPIVREYLMKNWSERRFDMNKKGVEYQAETRKGRSGAGGAWPHITQAFREDGNRMLFIEGPTYNKVPFNSHENLSSISHTDKTNHNRNLTKALLEKLERERLGVQTRYGTDNGNWTILR